MASSGTLPTYLKYVPGGLPSGPVRKTLRLREKYIVVLVLATFLMVCIGAVFYLPELRASNAYRHMKNAGPDLLLPPQALDDNLIRHNAPADQEDPHKAEDREKIKQKIEQDQGQDHLQVVRPQPPGSSSTAVSRKSWTPEKAMSEATVSGKPREVPAAPTDLYSESVNRERREKVREMMRHAWDNYERYAWGHNELRPISKQGHSAGIFGKTAMGATIVDGLDTLYLMGLTEQYKKGRDWVAENLSLQDVVSAMSNIHYDYNKAAAQI